MKGILWLARMEDGAASLVWRSTGRGQDLRGPVNAGVWAVSGVDRHYFRVQPRRAAFWEIGLGICHLSRYVPEQSTLTNFIEHAGVGVQWASGERSAWGIAYRFVHISNAGRAHPNVGLGNSTIMLEHTVYH